MAEQIPVLHIISRVISETIVAAPHKLIEQLIEKKFNFSFHQAPANTSVDNFRDVAVRPICGYSRPHLLPYFSDSTKSIPGAIVMVNDKLIHMLRAPALENQRDSYIWAYSPDQYFSPSTMKDIIREFVNEGMELKQYRPGKKDQSFFYSPDDPATRNSKLLHSITLDELTDK